MWDSFLEFLGNLCVFMNSERNQLGKRITIPLLELKLNNHHSNVTSLKQQTDVKLKARAGITGTQNASITWTFPGPGQKQVDEQQSPSHQWLLPCFRYPWPCLLLRMNHSCK